MGCGLLNDLSSVSYMANDTGGSELVTGKGKVILIFYIKHE
jgi:hypothetical protein